MENIEENIYNSIFTHIFTSSEFLINNNNYGFQYNFYNFYDYKYCKINDDNIEINYVLEKNADLISNIFILTNKQNYQILYKNENDDKFYPLVNNQIKYSDFYSLLDDYRRPELNIIVPLQYYDEWKNIKLKISYICLSDKLRKDIHVIANCKYNLSN
jgi:hypothetical protein